MTGFNIFHTSIVIRKRTDYELIDLTWHVLRKHIKPILFYMTCLALPFFLANFLLLFPLYCFLFAKELYEPGPLLLYWLVAVELLWFESRFASSLVGAWLGLWLFHDEEQDGPVPTSAVLETWFNSLTQLVWYTLLLRLYYYNYAFLPEIIMLEKTPYTSKGKIKLTTRRRARYFHRGITGTNAFVSFETALLSILSHITGLAVLYGAGSLLTGGAAFWFPCFMLFALPLFLWFSCMVNSVFLFLCYLNLRISREGWDLDIALHAEHERLLNKADFIPLQSTGLDRKSSSSIDDVGASDGDSWLPVPSLTSNLFSPGPDATHTEGPKTHAATVPDTASQETTP
ncbi:MAG: hypothetical protein Q4G68_06810 [Planctomycetia bacterium]|nr:hypothetical protein [Planctomycetia bacterium]